MTLPPDEVAGEAMSRSTTQEAATSAGSLGAAGSAQAPRTVEAPPEPPALLEVRDVRKHFEIRGGFLGAQQVGAVRAVDGVSFDVRRGETLGLVGESGCGKTTVGKIVLRLLEANSGDVRFGGTSIFEARGATLKALRRKMQIVFQDPYSSLDSRMTVGEIIGEGPLIHGLSDRPERERIVRNLLERVGLSSGHAKRYPHEFSGGQRQRIGIARALAVNPEFVVCDEPVSALDVSIQSQVLNLLKDLQEDFGLTYLFIAHNLAVVEHISDRVGVMYLGKIVEVADRDTIYSDPRHPYTVALLSAVPIPNPRVRRRRLVLRGDVPNPAKPPTGCRFHTRCWLRDLLGRPENCATEEPTLRPIRDGQQAACHWSERIEPAAIQAAIRDQADGIG